MIDYRIIILIIAVVVILFILIYKMNYKNLSWKENKKSYVGLLAMLTLLAAAIFSIQKDKNKQQKS